MIYTKDDSKLVRYYSYFEGINTFTGVVKDKENTIAYYLNGKWHREDGPAIEYFNGNKEWYVNDKLHREDGPAVERVIGNKEWYLNNKYYGQNDHYTRIIKMIYTKK